MVSADKRESRANRLIQHRAEPKAQSATIAEGLFRLPPTEQPPVLTSNWETANQQRENVTLEAEVPSGFLRQTRTRLLPHLLLVLARGLKVPVPLYCPNSEVH